MNRERYRLMAQITAGAVGLWAIARLARQAFLVKLDPDAGWANNQNLPEYWWADEVLEDQVLVPDGGEVILFGAGRRLLVRDMKGEEPFVLVLEEGDVIERLSGEGEREVIPGVGELEVVGWE